MVSLVDCNCGPLGRKAFFDLLGPFGSLGGCLVKQGNRILLFNLLLQEAERSEVHANNFLQRRRTRDNNKNIHGQLWEN